MPPNRRSLASCCALLILAIFAVYGRGLHGYFMADDFGLLNFGRVLSDHDPLYGLRWFWLSRGDGGSGTEIAKLYRPLSDLSFALQFRISGTDAFSYRLVNLCLHGASACLLMGILWRLLRSLPVALAAGLWFALSPAHPESLLWISARMNLMAGFFILLALYAFMRRGPESGWLPGTITLIAVMGALFSKETGLIAAPLLSLCAFCVSSRAGDSLTARCMHSLRETWPAWLLSVGYFTLRYQALGTLLGGYRGIDPWSASYWVSRMHLLVLYLAPVHQDEFGHWWKYSLLLLNLALLLAAILSLRARKSGAAITTLLVGWILLSLLPTYAAPFGESSWTQMQNSRLLYEPSAALVALLAVGLSSITSKPLALGSATCVALVYGSIAFSNAKPWIDMGRASEAIHLEAERWQQEDFTERWLVDVPGVESGAYLFFDHDPALRSPAFPAGLDQRVKLRRRSQWRQLMRRVARALREGRAQEFELYRFELADMSIEPESIPALFSASLGQGMELEYLRPARRKLHAGEAIPIQALLSAVPSSPPTLVVGLFDQKDRLRATSSHEIKGTLDSWTLPLPEDLAAGSYELRSWEHQELIDSIVGIPLGTVQVLGR